MIYLRHRAGMGPRRGACFVPDTDSPSQSQRLLLAISKGFSTSQPKSLTATNDSERVGFGEARGVCNTSRRAGRRRSPTERARASDGGLYGTSFGTGCSGLPKTSRFLQTESRRAGRGLGSHFGVRQELASSAPESHGPLFNACRPLRAGQRRRGHVNDFSTASLNPSGSVSRK